MGGAASILFWCAGVRPPQAWSACCSGALVWARRSATTPAGAGGWGRWGERCAGLAASPPPPRRGPFWVRGGVPSARAGRRVSPVALKLGGREQGRGARGPPSRPSAPSGVDLPSVVSGVPSRGILVPWGLPGGRGRRARSGRPPMGQCGGGGGGGGGNPPALVRAPVFPGPASEGAALSAPSWATPVCRRPAAGRACGRLPRPWCPLTPGAAASSGGVRGRRFFGLPPSALEPEGEGGGGGGPLVPWRRPLTAEGGRPGGPGPGGQPLAGGMHSSPAPLYLESDPREGPRWGLRGDDVASVGVDVVEVVVVVVVVVGVQRRHLLDAGGDAPHWLHVRLRGRPAPPPLCLTRPPPWAPMPRPACPLGPSGAPALALGPPSGPLPVPWVPPPVTQALACPLSHCLSLCYLHLGALPAPLRAFLCPGSFPAPCPESRRPLPALCPPQLLRPCSLPRVPWPAPCACSWALPLSPPVPRSAHPRLARSSACALSPPSWITRRASRCLCSCGSVTPAASARAPGGGRAASAPGGRAWGGTAWGGWCGRGRGWRGRGTSRPPCPLLLLRRPPARRPWPVRGPSPNFVACWGPRRGRPRLWRGSPGPRSQPFARPPASLLRLRQPSAMRPVPAPGLPPMSAACRGPRSGPSRGLLGLRSPLPARLGPPPGAGRQGLLLGRRGQSPRLAQAPRLTARCRQRPPGAAQPAA